ncbi:MAG: SurA N-terminal domain-containing protein [Flavobacteriales bacterium]|nr:SurA N-terminal domain-containing protein [Flavobacteriales bacterium]
MVIGKIREQSTLLLLLIGGAMLAFILGDLLNSGGFLLNGSPTEVGEIAGQTIEGRKFQERVDETIANYKNQTGQSSLDNNTTNQLRDQAWNQMVREIVLGEEFEAVGVRVSKEELYDMVQGNNPHPQVIQAFTNPETGQFDRAQVMNFLKQMEQDEDIKKRWVAFEKDIAKLRRNEKYNNLIKKGLYVTDPEAKSDFAAKNQKATIKFVLKRYASVPDSTIEVSDSDIKKYYNDHKSQYEQDASRDVEFVSFKVNPSQEDFAKVLNWAERLKPEFESTENDTLLVNRESDMRFNARWLPKGELGGLVDSLMFQAEKGFVYGPYLEGQTYRMAKLIGVKMAPDSVSARHILIRPQTYGNYDKAKAVADSLKKMIENGADFAELAVVNSEDPGSGKEGGDLGWFKEGQMVPTFNDACFDGKKGDLTLVESQFGFHIIEVLDQKGKTEKRAVTFIDRAVEPSTKTFQVKYGEADEFKRSITSIASFDQEVANRGLNKRIASNLKPNDNTIAGLENPRALIRWAFEAEKGDVSEVFELGDNFVVGVLTTVREEGYTAIDEIRDELETQVIKDKKAAEFMKEFDAARAGDIQTIANNMNLPVEVKDNVTFSSTAIPGLGREPALIGTISGMQEGDISKAIKGDQGVYVVLLESKSALPDQQMNLTNNKQILNSSLSARVDYEVYEALKEKADIKDNRSKFF